MEQLIGFNNYSASYDNYIQTYYSTEKNTLYNSKSNYAELEGKKSKDVNLVITKDGSIHVDGIDTGKKITPNSIMPGNTMNLHYIGNGKINDFRVRCRSESNLQCETLFLLDKNQKVKIIDRGEKKFLIDGEDWYWYYIETESGKKGWVYGKYLDIEN